MFVLIRRSRLDSKQRQDPMGQELSDKQKALFSGYLSKHFTALQSVTQDINILNNKMTEITAIKQAQISSSQAADSEMSELINRGRKLTLTGPAGSVGSGSERSSTSSIGLQSREQLQLVKSRHGHPTPSGTGALKSLSLNQSSSLGLGRNYDIKEHKHSGLQ